ncbi:MAG: type II toxin-antitoxin system Phd/YefM family antitoxin [Chloroflexota bacterium]
MKSVGVRDLKVHASEILRQVRDERDSFEVTYHGRVIARIVPVDSVPVDESIEEFWTRWDALAVKIRSHWPDGTSAVEAIREERSRLE